MWYLVRTWKKHEEIASRQNELQILGTDKFQNKCTFQRLFFVTTFFGFAMPRFSAFASGLAASVGVLGFSWWHPLVIPCAWRQYGMPSFWSMREQFYTTGLKSFFKLVARSIDGNKRESQMVIARVGFHCKYPQSIWWIPWWIFH